MISKIESALHPEFAALMVRAPGGGAHRVLASRGTAAPLQAIVRGLKGTIRVSSWPGEGAAFVVEVPVHEAQAGNPDRG